MERRIPALRDVREGSAGDARGRGGEQTAERGTGDGAGDAGQGDARAADPDQQRASGICSSWTTTRAAVDVTVGWLRTSLGPLPTLVGEPLARKRGNSWLLA